MSKNVSHNDDVILWGKCLQIKNRTCSISDTNRKEGKGGKGRGYEGEREEEAGRPARQDLFKQEVILFLPFPLNPLSFEIALK